MCVCVFVRVYVFLCECMCVCVRVVSVCLYGGSNLLGEFLEPCYRGTLYCGQLQRSRSCVCLYV